MKLSSWELAVARAAQVRDLGLSPEERRQGVVHTPPEMARAVVEGLDRRLRDLGFEGGLCGPAVTVVDPACGPGAFVAAVLALARGRGHAPGVIHAWDSDPSAVRVLQDALVPESRTLGVRLSAAVRDSLRCGAAGLPATGPVVVVGNPPWTVAARDASPHMQQLLEDFRRDGAGTRLPERKLGVLSDAYVRFFRLAAALVAESPAGGGLGLVTNGSFLDGPVHRGMRHALLRWFDAIEVLDLGGSALLSRASGGRAPRDENVFGVRPSVAVTWAIRRPPNTARTSQPCAALHATRLAGTRADKLKGLGEVARTGLSPAAQSQPSPPFFVFAPAAAGASRAYRAGIGLAEAMPFHREGVQTNRDRAVVCRSRETLLSRLQRFAAGRRLDSAAQSLERALPHYDPALARARVAVALQKDPDGRAGLSARKIAYRPFDTRFFAPISPLCHRPRPELLRAMACSDFALLTVRKDRGSAPYRHAAVVRHVADSSYLSARSSCRTRVFPERTPGRVVNFDPGVAVALAEHAGQAIELVAFVDYALALLHSARFTTAFDRALREDYPRIPLPDRPEIFTRWSALGQRLRLALVACADVQAVPGETTADTAPITIGHIGFAGQPALSPVRTALAAIAAAEDHLPDVWFR